MDDVADLQQVARDAGLSRQCAIGKPLSRPFHIFSENPVAVIFISYPFNSDACGIVFETQHDSRIPAIDITRHVSLGERFPPLRFVLKHFRVQPESGSAPYTGIAVILLKRHPQRHRRFALQVGIHGSPY